MTAPAADAAGAPETVAVVVSTFTAERKQWVIEALESAMRQTRRPDEVLLVLDPVPGLHDAYAPDVPEGTRIITAPRRGLSAARNAGVRHTDCDVVAFLDDDAEAADDWLERLLAPYADPRVAATGGYAEPRWLDGRPGWFPDELNWVVGCTYAGHPGYDGEVRSAASGASEDPNLAREALEVRNLIGCNMSFRRDALVDAGLFDEAVGRRGKRLVTAEETEMCMRVRRRSPESRIIYEPRAVVHHRVPRHRLTLTYIARRALGEGACKALIAKRLGGDPQPHDRNAPRETSGDADGRGGDAGGGDLSTEHDYLRFILKRGVGARLARAATLNHPLKNVAQAAVLLVGALVTGLGYLGGKTVAK